MPTKTLLSRISKEHRIRFRNNHNHVMMIIKKISPFINLIWEQHHQLTFVTIVQYVIQNCLSFAANKQHTEVLNVWNCQRLPCKSFSSTVWITITTWNFRDYKNLFVDCLPPLHVVDIIVAFCHKFQFIPPMAFALGDGTNIRAEPREVTLRAALHSTKADSL